MTDEAQGQEAPKTDEKKADTFPREYVEELRQENAKRRTEAKELAAQLEHIKAMLAPPDADAEKLKDADPQKLLEQKLDTISSQVASMLHETNNRFKREAFKTAALSAGVPADRLEAAAKLADLNSVQVGDDGSIGELSDVVTSLVESHPFLVETTIKTNAQPTNPAPTVSDPGLDAIKQHVRQRLTKGINMDLGQILD